MGKKEYYSGEIIKEHSIGPGYQTVKLIWLDGKTPWPDADRDATVILQRGFWFGGKIAHKLLGDQEEEILKLWDMEIKTCIPDHWRIRKPRSS